MIPDERDGRSDENDDDEGAGSAPATAATAATTDTNDSELTARVAAALETRWLGRSFRHLSRCRSTNDEAAAWAREGAPHGSVIVADSQSRGRGRLGRVWHSPVGENLYFSTVLRPTFAPQLAPPLTLAVAVALHDAVSSMGRLSPELKWPNDLLVDGKKIAGVLTEMSATSSATTSVIGHVIVGIGVNLETRAFPPELEGRATSLAVALATDDSAAPSPSPTIDRARFIAVLCRSLERWYTRFCDEGTAPVVDAWKIRARVIGRRITVAGGGAPLTGVAEDLDGSGALLLRTDDGHLHTIVAGELL